MLGESRENYLKSILILKRSMGTPRSVDLVHHTGYSKASISIAVNKLCEDGSVVIGGDGTLDLTALGLAEAEAVYERYRYFEEKLTDLGVPLEQAQLDACRLEHAISPESFEAVRRWEQQDPAKGPADKETHGLSGKFPFKELR